MDFRFRRPRITKSRQIDQHQPAAEIEEINLLGPARRMAGAGQRLAAGQRIDEARLADIRAAGEGDFGQIVRRQAINLDRAQYEPALLREEAPARFDVLG